MDDSDVLFNIARIVVDDGDVAAGTDERSSPFVADSPFVWLDVSTVTSSDSPFDSSPFDGS